jgi:phospholipid/cholesterol/gamma-HCH transport system substrate-binding protein
MMTRLQRSLAAVSVIVGLMGVTVLSVRASYGAFHHGYTLTGTFDQAAYGVEPGVQVEHHGIQVGRVTSVHLVDHRAQLILSINKGFRIPQSVVADIRPRSIFGDPFVDMSFPDAAPGPYLVAGARLADTRVDSQLGDLIASTVPLLRTVNGQELATIVSELAKANANEGGTIRAAIDNGAQLATLYASTIAAQEQALDAFAQFQAALAPTGLNLDAIAANSNVALPTLNAAEADFQRALDALTPFANKLANFIAQEKPDLVRLLDQGDNVVRLLTAREPQLEQVVSGAAEYLFKFAAGRGPETFPNGSKFAYFKNFIMFSQVNALVCGLLTQGGATIAPVLALVSSPGGAIDCSKAAAFTAAGSATASPDAAAAAQDLSNSVNQILGAPEVPQRLTVQALIDHILGRS